MQNENELVMESMVPTGNVEPKEKKVSKSLTMNEKRAMYGILSFLVIANRDGILDDAKTQELMEHLPIFGTVVEKKAYLSQEMFDMKMIEKDILKPMVVEHNNKKKQEKKQEKKKGKVSVKSEIDESKEVKEKKKRVNKKKEEVKEEGEEEVKEKKKRVNKKKEEVKEEVVKEEVKEEVKEKKKRVNKKKEEVKEGEEVKEKKRGRKTKEQIVECKVDVNVNEGNSQEDQLAELVNQLTDPRDIDVDDLETLLSNLEEEGEEKEGEEEKILPETPRLPDPVPVQVPVQVTKEKVQKKKTPKKKE